MPASNIGSYLQEARNNIDAMRPALISVNANQPMGQCQNMHLSTNCYYGYHNMKNLHTHHADTDCEMVESEVLPDKTASKTISRKRNAEDDEYPQKKRLREDNSSICSLVGTRSSPSHSASAFNVNIPKFYSLYLTYKFVFRVQVL